jgi:hypothetical protein
VQSVTDLIDANLLRAAPPRAVPLTTVLALVGQRLAGMASRILLDPLLLLCLGGVVVVFVLGMPTIALLLLIALLIRTWVRWRPIIRQIGEEVLLLRHGQIVRAYVLKAQVVRTLQGEVDGVCLECAIPLTERRTHIGSVWLADGVAALALARRGRVLVLALPGAPGSWRLLEGGYSRPVCGVERAGRSIFDT